MGHCRGTVGALSGHCRGTVGALSGHCRGAVGALSGRCQGAVGASLGPVGVLSSCRMHIRVLTFAGVAGVGRGGCVKIAFLFRSLCTWIEHVCACPSEGAFVASLLLFTLLNIGRHSQVRRPGSCDVFCVIRNQLFNSAMTVDGQNLAQVPRDQDIA